MIAVDIKQLTYRYAENRPPALSDVTLQVGTGEFVAVTGANNSGKSTLCYAIAGVVPHLFHGKMDGSVCIEGRDNNNRTVSDISRQVGLVLQKPDNQISGMRFTVFEEVAVGLENLGIDRQAMVQRVTEVLALMDLANESQRSPFHLSGGQQQRLALAGILAVNPPILILDEPTTFLDPQGALQFFTLLQQLQRQGKTIIISEQRADLIAAFAERVVVLEGGRVVMDGSPEEILTSPCIEDLGIARPRYTLAAELARSRGFWLKNTLPVTLSATVQELLRVEEHDATSR